MKLSRFALALSVVLGMALQFNLAHASNLPTPTRNADCNSDPHSSNNTQQSASPLRVTGVPVHNALGATSDLDWFSIEVKSGGTYHMYTSHLVGNVDTVLALIDQWGNILSVNDDDGQSNASSIVYSLSSSRIYYLLVFAKFGSYTGCNGAYHLSVEPT